jgi:ferredoxin--NADP+ reductase
MMRFLKSPTRIIGDISKKVIALELEDNTLDLQDNVVTPHGVGTYSTLDVDSIIFAIGDKVDQNIGLPVTANEFVKAATPRFPIDGDSFEVFDPQSGKIIEQIFVAGWSRKASSGLVGIARKDGVNCAHAIVQYLASLNPTEPVQMDKVGALFDSIEHVVINKEALQKLETIEKQEAEIQGLEDFKYNSNEDMLEAIDLLTRTESH